MSHNSFNYIWREIFRTQDEHSGWKTENRDLIETFNILSQVVPVFDLSRSFQDRKTLWHEGNMPINYINIEVELMPGVMTKFFSKRVINVWSWLMADLWSTYYLVLATSTVYKMDWWVNDQTYVFLLTAIKHGNFDKILSVWVISIAVDVWILLMCDAGIAGVVLTNWIVCESWLVHI